MSTFQERLKDAIGKRGYEICMRRSVQSVILYEAHRCISPQLAALRPFQRKLAFYDQANALLESIDFIQNHHKEEIMWRTATSREKLAPEVAWKRMKLIDRELEKLTEKVKPYIEQGHTHNEACDDIVNSMYEAVLKKESKNASTEDETLMKPPPLHWEHAHNNVMLTFRMYYRGATLDPTFPGPVLPRNIVVPAEKPKNMTLGQPSKFRVPGAVPGGADDDDDDDDNDNNNPAANQVIDVTGDDDEGGAATKRSKAPNGMRSPSPQEKRRRLLAEVREHLEILKQFEGVISQEDINRRKRELFLALPPAPPAAGGMLTTEPPVSSKKRGLGGGNASSPPAKKLLQVAHIP